VAVVAFGATNSVELSLTKIKVKIKDLVDVLFMIPLGCSPWRALQW
jgi:hypothetical protein